MSDMTAYPMRTEINPLETVAEFLVQHRLIAVPAAAWQERSILQGSFWMRRFPREFRAGGIGDSTFNSPSRHYGPVGALQ